MARAVISDPKRRAAFEPIYDVDPRTGASVEVFFADHVLAKSFGDVARAGFGGLSAWISARRYAIWAVS